MTSMKRLLGASRPSRLLRIPRFVEMVAKRTRILNMRRALIVKGENIGIQSKEKEMEAMFLVPRKSI